MKVGPMLAIIFGLIVHIVPSGAAARVPLVGRMIVLATPAQGSKAPKEIRSGFTGGDAITEGFDVSAARGTTVTVPASAQAYPKTLDSLSPGTYDMQPMLDVDRMYAYNGLNDGDYFGAVQRVRVTRGGSISLTLDKRYDDPVPKSTANVKVFDFISPVLSRFYGHPLHLRATVVLPPNYNRNRRYPVIYWQNGFGGNYRGGFRFARLEPMMQADGLNAVLVVTDSSGPTGITQYADSANNGPWGAAFTKEFIPAIERAYNIGGSPNRRLLWGHSSGGWAALWLQVTYPDMFGGAWGSSPDPVDFHDFTGPDLLDAPIDNAFVDRYGRPWQLVRLGTQNVMTLKQFVQLSLAQGYRASQFGSFDAVFSPRGSDGPMPLFNAQTGLVDPSVAAYWEAHYDIAANIERNYVKLAPSLQHKLHVLVGTLDTFHLERGVLRLDARLRRLGMIPNITYVPNASHFSLFRPQTKFAGYHWAFRGMAQALAAR